MFLRLLRDPLLYFVAAAALIFAAHAMIVKARSQPVVMSEMYRNGLIEEFEMLTGRPASQDDIRQIETDYVSEEILFREALGQGLHLTDNQTRSSLVEKMRFQITGAPVEPDSATLLEFYAQHPEYYRTEQAYSLIHVFFQEKPTAPQDVLSQLNAGGDVEADAYWLGDSFPGYGVSALRGIFGNELIADLETLPALSWAGPYESPRGWHFVRITENIAPRLLSFSEVAPQLRRDYQFSQTKAALDAYIGQLKETYDVVIER